MSRLIKFAALPVVAIALLVAADAPQADAAGFSFRIGGFGVHSGHHAHHGRAVRVQSFRHNYPSYHGGHISHRPWYHDTSHLHYHSPRIVPHNGHYDYVPGHYQVYSSGHWHH